MKKIFLICLFISSINVISVKGLDKEKNDKCSDCFDKESALNVANKKAKKILRNRIDNFEMKIEETDENFIIFYENTECRNNPLCKGGGEILIIISKKDCKIVDYMRFK